MSVRKIFIAIAAIAVIPSAVLAQPGRDWDRRPPMERSWNGGSFWRDAPTSTSERIDFLQRRVDRGVEEGTLDRHEARRVQYQLDDLRREIFAMRRSNGGHLDSQDRERISSQLDRLAREIRWMRHNDR